MRITDDVDVPEAVVSAAVDGTLVLFVGAGASFGPPSNLPSFDKLVELVARSLGARYDAEEPADVALGRLIDDTAAVRLQVRAILSDPQSLPNATHEAIVRLAVASPKTRVVTTNYDEHLSTAASLLGLPLGDRFNAPAVPLGRDFQGIVHLHGALSRSPEEWILTDSDFGRGYLIDGWARRFVLSAFQTFTVLFIGYSHEDPVMSYLARGLPPSSNRFVLTHKPQNPKWRSLQITPVAYPEADDHVALPTVLNALADRLGMGALNHRERVREIVVGGPPKSPVDIDYLRTQLSTPVGVRAFAESAADPDWLDWLRSHPVFADAFSGTNSQSDPGRVLGQWFAKSFFSSAEILPYGMAELARRGPVIRESLIQDLLFTAHQRRRDDPELWLKVVTIATSAVRPDGSYPGPRAMLHQAPITSSNVLPFIRNALRARLVLKESSQWWVPDEDDAKGPPSVSVEVAWSAEDHEIQQLLEVALSDPAHTASPLLQVLEQSIRQAYELRHNVEPDRSFDAWSFRRSAIEPHDQDDGRDSADAIIDGIREAAEFLATTDPNLGLRFLSGDVPLLVRIGIHLVRIDRSRSGDAKIGLLLDRELLFDLNARHEVFLLLEAAAPALSEPGRERLLRAIVRGPDTPDGRDRLWRRQVFDVLEWVSRSVTEWAELDEELQAIRDAEPDMAVREHSDMTHWMSSGSWGGALPMPADEFAGLIENLGAEVALRTVLGRAYDERAFAEPTWDDALSLIRQTAAVNYQRGKELMIASQALVPFDSEQVIGAVIAGWGENPLADEALVDALIMIEPYVTSESLLRPLAGLVKTSVGKGVSTRPEALLEDLGTIAIRMWEMCQAHPGDDREIDDWTFEGLNAAPGFLAQFWINRIGIRWRSDESLWAGLDVTERRALGAMLSDIGAAGRGPLAIIAGDVYFLHAADRSFTVEAVFPQFSAQARRSAQAWNAFLYRARVSDAMLDDGFWALLLDASGPIVARPKAMLEAQYRSLLASVVVYSASPLVDRNALFSALAVDRADGLAEFFDALAMTLEGAEPSTREATWDAWLCQLAVDRVAAITSTPEERTAWGNLAMRLPFVLKEALEITSIARGPLDSRTRFDNIPDSILADNADLLATEVEQRLRLATSADWHLEHELSELMSRLAREALPRERLRGIVDAALTIGIYSAAGWATQ